MNPWLLAPPLAFTFVLVLVVLLSAASKGLAIKPTSNPPGKFKSYACGEAVDQPRMQPDYESFFPFAFAFTLLHVVALVLAVGTNFTGAALGLAVLYVAAAGLGLSILLRK